MGVGKAGERLRTLGTGVAAVMVAAGALTLGTVTLTPPVPVPPGTIARVG